MRPGYRMIFHQLAEGLGQSVPIVLNLGCGRRKLPDAINCDGYIPADARLDLMNIPFHLIVGETACRIPSGTVRKVYLHQVLEHVPHPRMRDVLMEIQRVLCDDGELEIITPDFKAVFALCLKRGSINDACRAGVWGLQHEEGQTHYNGFFQDELAEVLTDLGYTVTEARPVSTGCRVPCSLWRATVSKPIEVTVYTPFGPGRAWMKDLWCKAFSRLDTPEERTKVVLVDNTLGDGLDDIAAFLQECNVKYEIVVDDEKLPKPCPDALLANKHRHLMNLAKPHFEGDCVLSLESDVLPPQGTYPKLREVLMREDSAGSVAAVQHSRQCRAMQIYELASDLDTFSLAMMKYGVTGARPVGSTHIGCTLFRKTVLDAIDMTTGWARGHDFFLAKTQQQHGTKPWVRWDLVVQHHRDPNNWV